MHTTFVGKPARHVQKRTVRACGEKATGDTSTKTTRSNRQRSTAFLGIRQTRSSSGVHASRKRRCLHFDGRVYTIVRSNNVSVVQRTHTRTGCNNNNKGQRRCRTTCPTSHCVVRTIPPDPKVKTADASSTMQSGRSKTNYTSRRIMAGPNEEKRKMRHNVRLCLGLGFYNESDDDHVPLYLHRFPEKIRPWKTTPSFETRDPVEKHNGRRKLHRFLFVRTDFDIYRVRPLVFVVQNIRICVSEYVTFSPGVLFY